MGSLDNATYFLDCQPVKYQKWRIDKCPKCGFDLEAYRKARRIKIEGPIIHRGVTIGLKSHKTPGVSFTLGGRRYLDGRRFTEQTMAIAAAFMLIDELLDSAKVEALDDE